MIIVDEKLTSFEMPALFIATDRYALHWQKYFLKCQKVQLVALVLVAVGGATSVHVKTFRVSAAVTVLALIAALFVRWLLYKHGPERKWYNGRAAAESCRNLAWKYVQRAEPFTESEVVADLIFIGRVNEILHTVPTLDQATPNNFDQITTTMRNLRAKPFSDRKKTYIQLRIEDQQRWYASKTNFNSKNARRWSFHVALLESGAIVLAIVRVGGGPEFDWSGILAVASAAAVAWLQSRQHETLAQSYSVTAQELASVRSSLIDISDEGEWAELVEQAEEAMSREHTLWRASHR
jgi:hypothetical protein